MTLTDDERARFAAYLERDAHDTRAIIEQTSKMGLPESILEQMTGRLKMEATAAEIVAKKLRSVTLEHMGR